MAQDHSHAFFAWLKQESERHWENTTLNPRIYGFQIQPGTRWLPGLKDVEIAAFEKALGFSFPQVYRDFLACMNGTDKETINLFGESEHAYTYDPGYYSYPRDLQQIKERIAWIYEAFAITEREVQAQALPHILPLVSHRFLIADNCESNPVLSMYERDVIIYAANLRTFLTQDILHDGTPAPGIPSSIAVKYWLEI